MWILGFGYGLEGLLGGSEDLASRAISTLKGTLFGAMILISLQTTKSPTLQVGFRVWGSGSCSGPGCPCGAQDVRQRPVHAEGL